MRNLYFTAIALFFGFSTNLFGQTEISPNPIEVNNFDVNQFEVVGYATVTNNSDAEVEYTWVRNVIEMTEGWSTAICDLNQCYLSFVSSQDFVLMPGSSGNLDVHLYPEGIEGSAIVHVTVFNQADTEDNATGVYLFNSVLSVPERLTNAIKIYPNPTSDVLFIEQTGEVARVELYTVSGQLVKSFQTSTAIGLNVSDLSAGNYVMRMFDADGKQASTNLLSINR